MNKAIVFLTLFILLSVPVMGIPLQDISSSTKTISLSANPVSFSKRPPISNIREFITSIIYQGKQKQTPLIHKPVDNFMFSPEDIDLQDDAFHGSTALHFAEWWYFDATFDFGYSVQVNFNIYNILSQGFASANINVYQYGEPLVSERAFYEITDFYASTETPYISIQNQPVMQGHIDEATGQWIYEITVGIGDIFIDLSYEGLTEGWKGITPVGGWGVILPEAKVMGRLVFNDEDVYHVRGIGYHDHNWDVTIFAGLNFGWLWGNIHTPNYTLVWADILTTWYFHEPLLVVNRKYNGYHNIDSEDITIRIDDIRWNHGMLIPNTILLDVHNDDLDLHMEMKTSSLQYISIWGIINYWRYHLDCTGEFTINGRTEQIDDIQIAEFIRFRFY
jgi:hypothetical protein